MGKRDRVLSCFPSFLRAHDSTKLLHEVVTRIARPLEDVDTHLFRIQRAHRLLVAEDVADIVKLAGALNLTAFHFEDLIADTSLSYTARLQAMRDRVRRVAMIHLDGLGTPWAVMEATAVFLGATIVPERDGEPLIAHLDGKYRSHKAVVEFAGPTPRRERIYLHEGLYQRRRVEPQDRWQLNSWIVNNSDPEPSPARFVVRGVSDHTVRPSLFCPSTGEGFWFNGVVPERSTLVIDRDGGARLDDQPVDDWLVTFQGGIFDFSRTDAAPFVEEQGHLARSPFLGDLEDVIESAVRERVSIPPAPVGRSEWFYKVATGLYDASDFDLAVFDPPSEPVGIFDDMAYDGGVFDYPSAGVVAMGWDESIPCTFKLQLPPQPEAGGDAASSAPNSVTRISAVLPRFRAAGVRAIVETAKNAWILGESVVRDAAATTGEGATRHATRLYDESADRFVPLDSTPAEAGATT